MNWDWQEWVVVLLVVACVVRAGYAVRTFFYRAKKNMNPCSSCASGCELKNQLDKKKQECKGNKPFPKKKYCG